MSRAEAEHGLARGLEGKEIRLKNNTTTSLSRAASMDSQFHESNALAGKDRQWGDNPKIGVVSQSATIRSQTNAGIVAKPGG